MVQSIGLGSRVQGLGVPINKDSRILGACIVVTRYEHDPQLLLNGIYISPIWGYLGCIEGTWGRRGRN